MIENRHFSQLCFSWLILFVKVEGFFFGNLKNLNSYNYQTNLNLLLNIYLLKIGFFNQIIVIDKIVLIINKKIIANTI